MKLILIIVAFITIGFSSKAQTYDTIPPYKKDSSLPNFVLLKSDSTWLRTSELSKHKPIVIIFFNPDCVHCQHEAENLSKKINDLKNIDFVWTTYSATFHEVDSFAHQYGLDIYKNFYFTKDPNYLVPQFYRLQMTPFIAAYDKHKRLVKTWAVGAKPEEILEAVK